MICFALFYASWSAVVHGGRCDSHCRLMVWEVLGRDSCGTYTQYIIIHTIIYKMKNIN